MNYEKRPSKVVRMTLNVEMKVLGEELSKMQPQAEVVLSLNEEEQKDK